MSVDSHGLELVNGGVWWMKDVVMIEWHGYGVQLPGSRFADACSQGKLLIVHAKNRMPRTECLAVLGSKTKTSLGTTSCDMLFTFYLHSQPALF